MEIFNRSQSTIENPMAVRGFDRLLTTQRPAVLAHVRNVRRSHPTATPEQIIRILERHYLTAVTAGGASVGATAVVPGVGTGISLALTGVETAVFLEASALFAQSVTEIHGITMTDPDRARTIVMAMMLGTSGADLVRNLAAQATGNGVPRARFWGDVIGRNVPQAFMGQIADRVKRSFIQRFARNTTAGALGRIMPFGIGAVIGGVGSNMLGRKIVESSRQAFGPPPAQFPLELEPRERRMPHDAQTTLESQPTKKRRLSFRRPSSTPPGHPH
ncbi:MAG: hypothetical protein JWP30_968 [Homoserinimonas sp.]|nr:hypothetical protein [Homoserinimonas sp.]